MESENLERKELKHAIDTRLNSKQRDVYFKELAKVRKKLVESGEARNVPNSQRWEILEGIEEGTIKEYNSPYPNVDQKKMERDFEAAGRPMKGAKDD
jgi:hypothetical protein